MSSPISSKERFSNSTTHSFQPDFVEQDVFPQQNSQQRLKQQLSLYFQNKVQQLQISPKHSEKAVSWLLTNCWLKSMNFESTILAVTVFYIFKSKKVLRKSELQLLLGVCMLISSKIERSPELSFQEISELISDSFSIADIEEKEAEVLQILDYDLYFDYTFMTGRQKTSGSGNLQNQVYFLVEIFLLKSENILFNQDTYEQLIDSLNKKDNSSLDLQKLLNSKQAQIIKQKYSSMLDIEDFCSHLLKKQ